MDSNDEEALMAILQAQQVALTALYQSHPTPSLLLVTLMRIEARAPGNEHPAYMETLNNLRSVIGER